MAVIDPAPPAALRTGDREAIERIVDYAFWQLMLVDDPCQTFSSTAALCAALWGRCGEVLADIEPRT